jgi:hypothetical protein
VDGVAINMDMLTMSGAKVFAEIDVARGSTNWIARSSSRRPLTSSSRRQRWDPLRSSSAIWRSHLRKSGHTPQLEEPRLFDAQLLQLDGRAPRQAPRDDLQIATMNQPLVISYSRGQSFDAGAHVSSAVYRSGATKTCNPARRRGQGDQAAIDGALAGRRSFRMPRL